ncbi:MAG: cation-transporting P-type ATPase [Acidimicrobiales bacterium]|nr:cation-transporting P-type ATPase [Acidimicrobiales bacterium]
MAAIPETHTPAAGSGSRPDHGGLFVDGSHLVPDPDADVEVDVSTTPQGVPPLRGLNSAEAGERLSIDGPNQLPKARRVPAWRRFASQLVHFFALMLWVAGILALLAGMPELAIAIFAVILVNGAFAFVQESRAERTAEGLKDLLPRRAFVVRDGRRDEIDAGDLVVGDLVVLRSGDRISADMEVLGAEGLTIDTSMLTGESAAVSVAEGEQLFAGCFVVGGEGMARVQAAGAHTRLASIAESTRKGRRPPSPLEREFGRGRRRRPATTASSPRGRGHLAVG